MSQADVLIFLILIIKNTLDPCTFSSFFIIVKVQKTETAASSYLIKKLHPLKNNFLDDHHWGRLDSFCVMLVQQFAPLPKERRERKREKKRRKEGEKHRNGTKHSKIHSLVTCCIFQFKFSSMVSSFNQSDCLFTVFALRHVPKHQ